MVCPKECEDDRHNLKENIKDLFKLSIPAWARGLLLTMIGVLFILYGGQWLYNVSTFATKEDLKEVKIDLKHEISQGFAMLELKLAKGK